MTDDLSFTGYVTRTELALGNLTLNDSTYRVIRQAGWGPGDIEWDRQTVESPFIHGDFLVNAKKTQVTAPLGIRVTGSSRTDCQNKLATLLRAFEQFSYFISFTLEGVTWTWLCQPADYSVGDGGALQPFHLMSNKQEVRFSIPRYPTPYSGPT